MRSSGSAGASSRDFLDPALPVRPYWIMHARDPVNEEGLTMLERNTAYGSTCTEMVDKAGAQGEKRYSMVLSALKNRPIQVWADATGELHAVCTIDGKPDELLCVFFKTTSSWLGPSVDYIELRGITRTERIHKK